MLHHGSNLAGVPPFPPGPRSPFSILPSPLPLIPRELFRKIRHVEIRTKGLVEELFGGEYHSAFKGRGIEFAEVRPYQIGDDVRTIDWSVTARTGEPFVKLYEEEREQTLLLCVDVSASEAFGSTGTLKRDLAAEVCAVLEARKKDRISTALPWPAAPGAIPTDTFLCTFFRTSTDGPSMSTPPPV